jgi:hypothetical protein
MAWTPKSTAPATFNLADAFLALITGDATWGWLVDWLPYVTNDHFNTADFCAFGPTPAPDLSVLLTASPPDRSPLAVVAKIAALGAALTLAARDRVFGAYCHEVAALVGGWGTPICKTNVHGSDGWGPSIAWDVPAGATSARIRQTAGSGSFNYQLRYYPHGVFAGGNFTDMSPVLYANNTNWTTGYTIFGCVGGFFYLSDPPGSVGASETFCIEFNVGDVADHVPAPQPEPAGLLSPLRAVEASLAGIAHEAELLEFKMDTMMSIIQSIAGATLDLGGPASDPADVTPDVPIEVKDAVGCILVASGIPASRSLDFGEPKNVVRLAHINLGTPLAWYPSIWMTHTPMIVRPFPPGTTKVTITDLPPGCSVTIQMILPTK